MTIIIIPIVTIAIKNIKIITTTIITITVPPAAPVVIIQNYTILTQYNYTIVGR